MRHKLFSVNSNCVNLTNSVIVYLFEHDGVLVVDGLPAVVRQHRVEELYNQLGPSLLVWEGYFTPIGVM